MDIRAELPIKLVSVANIREHWAKRAKRAKSHRVAACLAMRPKVHGWSGPCVVRITRIAPRALDGDNLSNSAKALRDGIADAMGIDDRDPRITWEYAQERGAPKQYAVRVEVRLRSAFESQSCQKC